MEKLNMQVPVGGDARMPALWMVEMPIEKVILDILQYLNLRYQGSLILNDKFELKELTYEPIGYNAGSFINED